MYVKGQGVPANHQIAFSWFEQSAKNGNPVAQGNLGELYFRGKRGIPRSFEKAYLWNAVAVMTDKKTPMLEQRSRQARSRELAAKELTPEKLAELEQAVARCWDQPKTCP